MPNPCQTHKTPSTPPPLPCGTGFWRRKEKKTNFFIIIINFILFGMCLMQALHTHTHTHPPLPFVHSSTQMNTYEHMFYEPYNHTHVHVHHHSYIPQSTTHTHTPIIHHTLARIHPKFPDIHLFDVLTMSQRGCCYASLLAAYICS